MLYATTCCTYSTNFSIVGASTARNIILCVSCSTFSFSSSDRVRWQASSSHNCNLIFRRASFLCNSSTCSCNYFPSCNFSRSCTGAKVRAISRTSSYFCHFSQTSVIEFCRFGSSSMFFHNSVAASNIVVQSLIATSKVFIFSLMAAACSSRTFGRVVGYNFNYSSAIFI